MTTDQQARLQKYLKRLDHPDPAVRLHAGLRLGDMGPDAREAIPRLRELLISPALVDRRIAAMTLGSLGSVAIDTLGDLHAAMQDADAIIRRLCTEALVKIQGGADTSKAA